MPNKEPLSESKHLTPRQARHEAQLILGQIHGFVWLAVNEVDSWLEQRQATETGEVELTADDIRRASAEIHGHFGILQAALNTGKYDAELVGVGISGAQGEAKKKGFLGSIARFIARKAEAVRDYVTLLRGGLRWSGTLIGSIEAALKKEADRVPGAAAAGEAIKEFLEVLMNATEPPEASREAPPAQQKGRAQIKSETAS